MFSQAFESVLGRITFCFSVFMFSICSSPYLSVNGIVLVISTALTMSCYFIL